MGPIYHLLGLTVGVIQHEMSYLYDPDYLQPDIRLAALRPCSRREAYRADITYGTNNEFGFDYLRDNMRFSLEEMVQREHYYAIVDEVDSILIDEARTPLIISGPAEGSTASTTDRPHHPKLTAPPHHRRGKLSRSRPPPTATISSTEGAGGIAHGQGFHAARNSSRWRTSTTHSDGSAPPHQQGSRRMRSSRRRGLRREGRAGGHRGRVHRPHDARPAMVGWAAPGGEAKEAVKIESGIDACTITLQNYFRMYDKLAGMTGTAATEAEEFAKIYELDVTVVPTNRSLIRVNHPDVVYKTAREKFEAASNEIAELHAKGQPVLVGTVSIDISEHLSRC